MTFTNGDENIIQDLENKKNNFINSFDYISTDFHKPTVLIDSKIGFSTYIEYEDKFTKKIGLNNGKKYASLFYVYIKDEFLETNGLKPVVIHASFHEFKESGFYEIGDIKNSKIPVNLKSKDDYFYDIKGNKFYSADKKEVTLNQIITEIYNLHIKTTKRFKGLILRLKIVLKNLFANSIKSLSNILVFILFLISGYRYDYDIINRHVKFFSNKKNPEINIETDASKDKTKKITIFDYEASSWAITTFCLIHLLLYVLLFQIGYKPQLIKILLSNNFLTVSYVIVSLAIFESGIPKLLKMLIKNSTDYYIKTVLKEIKI